MDTNFIVQFGVNRIVPLKEDGESISVTQENKREFVQLSAQYRLYSSIKEQIEHLSAGFYEISQRLRLNLYTPMAGIGELGNVGFHAPEEN